MKKAIYIIISTFFLYSCVKRERNCNDYRTGKYESVVEMDDRKFVSQFTRYDNQAIETFEGITDTFSVRWINNCEFITRKLHPVNREDEKAVHIKILYTSAKGYSFEFYTIEDSEKNLVHKFRGEAKKLK